MKNPVELLKTKTSELEAHLTAATRLRSEIKILRDVVPLLLTDETPEIQDLVRELLATHGQVVGMTPEDLEFIDSRTPDPNSVRPPRRLLAPEDVMSRTAIDRANEFKQAASKAGTALTKFAEVNAEVKKDAAPSPSEVLAATTVMRAATDRLQDGKAKFFSNAAGRPMMWAGFVFGLALLPLRWLGITNA